MSHINAQPLYATAALRQIEQLAAAAKPALMSRAGDAAAKLASKLASDQSSAPILILVGPGNNGGDGYACALALKLAGRAVTLAQLPSARPMQGDALTAQTAWKKSGGAIAVSIPDGQFSLVIDALFGIGLDRDLSGEEAAWVGRINQMAAKILSLDIPSGLHADTGRVLGVAVQATHTLSFLAHKPGLFTLNGPDYCGELHLDTLGQDLSTMLSAMSPTAGHTLTPACFQARLKPRLKNSHKGMMGAVAVLGGAAGMQGAALLAARAALHLGAGRVFLGLVDRNTLSVDPLQPELMLREPRELLAASLLNTALNTVAIGPGLGQSGMALNLLHQCMDTNCALVIDADALNLLASHTTLANNLAKRSAPAILTPHPLEASRLLACKPDEVQANRVGAALELAKKFRAVVALKGCGTVTAEPSGRWWINTTGNAGLASAGTGDVLTGITAALLAQGWPAIDAANAGVHVHGAAADQLAANQCGPIGMTASELITPARCLFNRWIAS